MARAGVEWSIRELARRSGVGVTTITRFEKGHSMPIRGNISALRRTFEAAGVEFRNGDGLRVRKMADGS
jgi:transcriptional regulator with XRE-family HTH domain